jgi:hypothetical protein
MLNTWLWFWCCYFISCFSIARYQVILGLASRNSLKFATVSPGFLRAGRPTVNSVNFDHSAHLVTVGHGCSAVLVSCSGRTAGITL